MLESFVKTELDKKGWTDRNAATRAARQQPRQLRSASLTHVRQSVRETKPTVAKVNKYLGDSRIASQD